jgi:hypothetical protein
MYSTVPYFLHLYTHTYIHTYTYVHVLCIHTHIDQQVHRGFLPGSLLRRYMGQRRHLFFNLNLHIWVPPLPGGNGFEPVGPFTRDRVWTTKRCGTNFGGPTKIQCPLLFFSARRRLGAARTNRAIRSTF